MSNKKRALPKEVYLLETDLNFLSNNNPHMLYIIEGSSTDVLGGQIKYLSEESVKEMLADKDKEVERLKSENQKLNKVELFRYEHGFEACSIVYLINGEIHLYSIPMYGGEEKEEYIDFIDLEDLIEKIKKFT